MSINVPFLGRPERTAKENLGAFIEHAKDSRIFRGNNAVRWENNSWDLRPWVKYRGSSRTYLLHFVDYESQGRSTTKNLLPEPFRNATKALAAYSFTHHRPSTPYRWIIALRMIDKAFRDLGRPSDISKLDVDVLDRAAEIARGRHANPTHTAPGFENVSRTVSGLYLCQPNLLWRFPFDKDWTRYDSTAVSRENTKEISTKLPHLKCILDLASVFRTATNSPDVISTAWFALSMFSPSRVSEVLALPVTCETEIEGVYGLSWQPSKGGDPLTKFATTEEWREVAQTAIRRLIELGEPARRAAAWYFDHPDALYLPPQLSNLREQPVTRLEIQKIVGSAHIDAATMNRMGIKPSGLTTADPCRTGGKIWAKLYTFQSLESWVLAQLPKDWFSDKLLGIHARDALFCVPRHSMSNKRENQIHIPMLINDTQINKDLSFRANTIFHRHDLRHPETGVIWKLTSNQPRHLLNTLAQSKHLSQTLIAFWSGRRTVDQNKWYNHIPQETFIEAYVGMGEYAPREIKIEGPLVDKIADRARKEHVSKDDALRLEIGSIIATRYGLCRHNYALTPCPKDKACIDCGENTFIKGDARQVEEAKRQLAISERALENCRLAIAEGEPGVERWLLKHETGVARWSKALERLLDPNLEDGTLITLPPPEVSQSKTGLTRRIYVAEALVTKEDDDLVEAVLLVGDS